MIESHHWKTDLLHHAKRLRPVAAPKRWSEKRVVNFEKELMISFFMVRALLEREKLSSTVRNHKVLVTRFPWNGKHVTRMNYHAIHELYDFEQGRTVALKINFLANQFVHARAIFAGRDETRNWSEVLLCSDHERAKAIYSVPVAQIQEVFHVVARDHVSVLSMTYDETIGDYRVDTN